MRNIRAIGALGAATAVLLASLFPALAVAGQAHQQKLVIAIDDGTEDGQVFINVDDAQDAIDIDKLQVGESRSIVDEQGRSILLTKTETGLDLNVDGRVIALPSYDDGQADLEAAAVHPDSDVKIERRIRIERTIDGGDLDDDTVTIISNGVIDDATKEQIRSILSSSGQTGDVVFIDGHGLHDATSAVHDGHDAHRVKIISKEISATN